MTEPITLARVLASRHTEGAEAAVRAGLERAGTAAQVTNSAPPVLRLVERRVAEELRPALSVDVGGVLVEGWLAHRRLIETATRGRDHPGSPQYVELATHEISQSWKPSVDVYLNGTLTATLEFELTLGVEIRALEAEVDAGRLMGLRGGGATATVTLTLDGQPVARAEQPLTVGATVRLGGGLELVPPPAATAQPTAATTATPTGAARPPAAAPPTIPSTADRTTAPPTGGSRWWESPAHPPSGPSAPETASAPAEPERPWWERTVSPHGREKSPHRTADES